MKLAILETGRPPQALQERFGSYPQMFNRLLGGAYNSFDVQALELPARVEDYDAYLVTGSSAGVYEDLPWIEPAKDFLRAARGKAKLVGVCFGHQLMAEAFGGKVIKSPKGWGIGLHRYDVVTRPDWVDGAGPVFAPASHQDQVVEQPPGTEVVLASDFTPFAALRWTDQPAISFQFHPEFEPEYASALIEGRIDARHDRAFAEAAIESLRQPNDRLRVGQWIEAFLKP
ncbi:MAG: type 1 glutamine amidotransferase [Caulobacteraceae bacterium]|nr:type 1 glutamine amidotransferase [Caulobacteraceae bacterium]